MSRSKIPETWIYLLLPVWPEESVSASTGLSATIPTYRQAALLNFLPGNNIPPLTRLGYCYCILSEWNIGPKVFQVIIFCVGPENIKIFSEHIGDTTSWKGIVVSCLNIEVRYSFYVLMQDIRVVCQSQLIQSIFTLIYVNNKWELKM